jgi:hypothetical protein
MERIPKKYLIYCTYTEIQYIYLDVCACSEAEAKRIAAIKVEDEDLDNFELLDSYTKVVKATCIDQIERLNQRIKQVEEHTNALRNRTDQSAKGA